MLAPLSQIQWVNVRSSEGFWVDSINANPSLPVTHASGFARLDAGLGVANVDAGLDPGALPFAGS